MEIKVYKANPTRMEKVVRSRDSFQLKVYRDIEDALNRDIVNLISVYVYNGHEVSVVQTERYTTFNFMRRGERNSSAFFFREFSPTDLKCCLVCQHTESIYNNKNIKKTHCKLCEMEYNVCDKCSKKVDFDLLSEEEKYSLRWSDHKFSIDNCKYTDHETYISKNFCSTACLEAYKIMPQEELE